MKPYQFAVLRYVHNASSGEFVNVGVVLWCAPSALFAFELNERYGRLSSFFKGAFDGVAYRAMLRRLKTKLGRLAGQHDGQPGLEHVNDKDLDELLDWVLPEDDSCFQWSAVMGGIAADPRARLRQLFAELVERHEAPGPRQRRDETEIWTEVERALRERGLLGRVETQVEIGVADYSYKFKLGWMNGVRQVLEPISLDFLGRGDVLEKANTWCGRLLNLSKSEEQFQFTGVVSKPEREDLIGAFNQATRLLREAPRVRAILQESEVAAFLPDIEHDLEHRE